MQNQRLKFTLRKCATVVCTLNFFLQNEIIPSSHISKQKIFYYWVRSKSHLNLEEEAIEISEQSDFQNN